MVSEPPATIEVVPHAGGGWQWRALTEGGHVIEEAIVPHISPQAAVSEAVRATRSLDAWQDGRIQLVIR